MLDLAKRTSAGLAPNVSAHQSRRPGSTTGIALTRPPAFHSGSRRQPLAVRAGRLPHVAGGPSGFDPQELTVEASLNRVTIGEMDGVPDGVAGRPAAETCSRNALAEMAKAAGILSAPDAARLADQLGALTTSPDREVRAGGGDLLQAFGSRLGALIATLRHPDTPAHQGASPARRAHFEHWLG